MHLYTLNTPAETLTAATAKSCLAYVGTSTRRHSMKSLKVSGSSVTATDAPMKVEICRSNQGAAGTSTSTTPQPKDQADPAAIGAGARTYTVEPTTLTVIDTIYISPIGNTFLWELPTGREYEQSVSISTVIRITAPAGESNVAVSMDIQE